MKYEWAWGVKWSVFVRTWLGCLTNLASDRSFPTIWWTVAHEHTRCSGVKTNEGKRERERERERWERTAAAGINFAEKLLEWNLWGEKKQTKKQICNTSINFFLIVYSNSSPYPLIWWWKDLYAWYLSKLFFESSRIIVILYGEHRGSFKSSLYGYERILSPIWAERLFVYYFYKLK